MRFDIAYNIHCTKAKHDILMFTNPEMQLSPLQATRVLFQLFARVYLGHSVGLLKISRAFELKFAIGTF